MKLGMPVKLAALAAAGLGGWFFLRHRIAHAVLGSPPFDTFTYDQALEHGVPVDSSVEPKDLPVGSTVYITARDGDRLYFVPAAVQTVDPEGNTAHVVTATSPGDDPPPGLGFDVTHAIGYLDRSMTGWLSDNGYGS